MFDEEIVLIVLATLPPGEHACWLEIQKMCTGRYFHFQASHGFPTHTCATEVLNLSSPA